MGIGRPQLGRSLLIIAGRDHAMACQHSFPFDYITTNHGLFPMSFSSYLPLPTALGAHRLSRPRNRERTTSKRHLRILLVVVIVGAIVWYLQIPRILLEQWTLPYYEEYRNHEDHLPHYSNEAPYPNGRHAKYILFGTHQKGARILRSLFILALT